MVRAVAVTATAAAASTTGADVDHRGQRVTKRILAILCILCGSAVVASLSGQESLAVVASKAGFKPKVLNLHKGEPAKIVLTTADDEHCFAVDALRIEKRVTPGKPTTLELTPDRVGTFPFYCCLELENETQRGKLVVVE